jgi:prepilin-type N-terminal cleavage/methylation domain-containing protein
MINFSAEKIGVNSMEKFTVNKDASISVNQLRRPLQILGFNLIELMLVISIIGLLSAIATVSYTTYIAQGKLTEALGLIDRYKAALMVAYVENNAFPATVGDLSAAAYTTLTYNNVNLAYYNVATNSQAAYIRLYTRNTGIPSATLSAAGAEGNYTRITLVLTAAADGHFVSSCGQWGNGSAIDIPAKYLPSSCAQSNLTALIT